MVTVILLLSIVLTIVQTSHSYSFRSFSNIRLPISSPIFMRLRDDRDFHQLEPQTPLTIMEETFFPFGDLLLHNTPNNSSTAYDSLVNTPQSPYLSTATETDTLFDCEERSAALFSSEWSLASILLVTVFTIATLTVSATSASAFPFFSSTAVSSSSSLPGVDLTSFNSGIFDPASFQPVCPASDSFYQVTKSLANTLVGSENVAEYGPLIASVLLRVRLELCVFESFLYEAVLPFIKQKGLSWILPLHETLETFIAGTVFAVASNFILLGSTKIFTVLLIYFDALIGWPVRIIGKILQKLAKNSSKNLTTLGQALTFTGDVVGGVRQSVEVIDTFVGRYLVFATTVYIIVKFAHYKFFNYY